MNITELRNDLDQRAATAREQFEESGDRFYLGKAGAYMEVAAMLNPEAGPRQVQMKFAETCPGRAKR